MNDVLKLVHHDLQELSQADKQERETDFTSENLFRAIILMHCEGWTFREATIRIADSVFFQNFCRLTKKKTIDYTLLNRVARTIKPETWETINRCFARRMKQKKLIDTDQIRSDTTVTECNIHYPTDSSLLWDVYRTIARLVIQARRGGCSMTATRFHLAKIKKLHLNVTRFSKSKNKKRQRWVKSQLKLLIERVGESVVKARRVSLELAASSNVFVRLEAEPLARLLPTMERIVNVASRNWHGEKVPVEDKVFSLFEEHTELIQRGRRGKPIEFGHKVLFSETKEEFITDCRWA